MNAPRPNLLPVCPECGASSTAPPPRGLRGLSLLPLLVVLAALGLVAVETVRTAPAGRSSYTNPPESGFPQFPAEPITDTQLRRIADDPSCDDGPAHRFLLQLLEPRPRTINVLQYPHVALVPPLGYCSQTTTYGWPWTTVTTGDYYSCDDVYNPETRRPTPARPMPRTWYWMGTSINSYGAPPSLGIDVGPPALCVFLGIVLVVGGTRLARRLARRSEPEAAARRWRRRLVLAVIVALAALAAYGGLCPKRTVVRSTIAVPGDPDWKRLGVSLQGLREMAAEPDAGRRFARLVADRLPKSSSGRVLACDVWMEAHASDSRITIGWPLTYLHSSTQSRTLPVTGAASPIPAHPTRAYWQGAMLVFIPAQPQPSPGIHVLQFDFGAMAMLALGLMLLWLVTLLISGGRRRARTRRRHRLGQCLACGYDLRTA